MKQLEFLDYAVFIFYFLVVASYGLFVFYRRRASQATSKDFFLAEGSLTWWAIGASLIASNISAEHFIGMSGSGFALGLAISTYEWMGGATLLIVAVFFVPIYLKNRIYTMPQFLSDRYSPTVSTVMAIFWLLVYVFVNLTSIIYLGALAINAVTGISFGVCVTGLAVFAIIVTLGGMKVIGYTDVIQVAILIIGGLVTTYLAVTMVAEHFGYGKDILAGLQLIKEKAPSHFHMIFADGHPYYRDLPGLSVLIGGMWINNLNYWGCNQYIIQRALGADLKTARSGILFAAFLKLLIPVIAVIPGIAAFVLYSNGMFQSEMVDASGTLRPDHAYPTLLHLLPAGLKGLAFAALTAAIVASLAGKANSISTIFSLDIYKKFFNKDATELSSTKPLVSQDIDAMDLIVSASASGTSFYQEYVGFISPGVLAIFLLGIMWRRATATAALASALLTIPLSAVLKFLPAWTGGVFPDYPFLDRMTIVFVFLIFLMVIISLADSRSKEAPKIIEIDKTLFRCSPGFIAGSTLIIGILIALYTVFW